MRLKSFYGPTMTEAMRQVREALGDNAIIVATRDDEMGGVRVTAAIDDPITPARAAPTLKTSSEPAPGEAVDVIATALVSHHVPQALSEKLLATATQFASEDPLLALGAALDMHFTYAPMDMPPGGKPHMLIGPPGAGKTLCASKLATQATMAGHAVSLISTDTIRAGGMAQLDAFARLLKCDMMEIEDAPALSDVLSIQKPDVAAIIDTAGCNPFDHAEREHLAAFIRAAKADVTLVLPADMDAMNAIDLAKEFAALGATRLLFTRLDMTRRVGGLIHAAYESRLALGPFSATAKVTEPPQPMNPVSLARLVLPKTAHKPSKATATA